ncbi:hypothetical protein N9Y42_03690 [Mariniblastus sp.]|nr:hypothetical protein [Mariniblastus sp.]
MPGVAELIILALLLGIPLVCAVAVVLFFVLRRPQQSGSPNDAANMRSCVGCQLAISAQAKFCPNCGEPQKA